MKHTTQQASLSDSTALLQTRDGQQVNIPYEGSLGLLALGDIGLVLWRQAKENYTPANTT